MNDYSFRPFVFKTKECEKESVTMHIIAVGKSAKIGSSVNTLMNKIYNKERESVNGLSANTKTVESMLTVAVTSAKITMESNLSRKIRRPQLMIQGEVQDVWGAVSDEIDHVSFLPESKPSVTYVHTLEDDEIKMLVDAGLYRNKRFEELFSNLAEKEVFEVEADADVQVLELLDRDQMLIPVVLVNDFKQLVYDLAQPMEERGHTTFNSVIQRAVSMAIELEQAGVSDSILGEEEHIDDEVEVTVAEEFTPDNIQSDTSDEDSYDDQEVLLDDGAIDSDSIFGQTTEESEIERLKRIRDVGVDIEDVTDSDDSFESDADWADEDQDETEDEPSVELADDMVILDTALEEDDEADEDEPILLDDEIDDNQSGLER